MNKGDGWEMLSNKKENSGSLDNKFGVLVSLALCNIRLPLQPPITQMFFHADFSMIPIFQSEIVQ